MTLEEKTNNVKYQGRDDYRVVYFDVHDGEVSTKYFFLNEGNDRLKNGNVIATTNLKVAIGANKPEELADIGVISPEGLIVIPFNNRKIKVIDDNTLLVEPATPVSENVTKAIGDRTNPQEATRLVSAANTIKEKINVSMGAEGKFIFNDLFSEATIYDIDGNNLVNGEYYSFIGTNDSSVVLCKNDPETEVVTIPLKKQEVVTEVENTPEESVEEVLDTEVAEPAAEVTEPVDVSEVQVDETVVEDAFNNEEVENTPEETAEEVLDTEVTEPITEVTEPVDVSEETTEAVDETIVEEEPVDEETEEVVEEMPDVDLVQFTPEKLVEPEEEEIDMSINEDNEELEEEKFDRAEVKENYSDKYGSFDDFADQDQDSISDAREAAVIVDKLVSKMKNLEEKNNDLENQLGEQKEKLSQLKVDFNRLKEKTDYYERAAVSLDAENRKLKEKVKSNEKLFSALNEASKWLKEDEEKYEFGENNVYRRVS